MSKILELLRREYPVKVYQWAMIWLVLIALWAGGIIGALVYVRDQNEALHQAERERCVQRVESRSQIRGAFIDVYELINELNPGSEFAAAARARLNTTYPPLDLDECFEQIGTNA